MLFFVAPALQICIWLMGGSCYCQRRLGLVMQPTFAPIVCGEVFTKLAAKLATARVVSSWPLPSSCFGCEGGKGVSEAIYLVKHAVQESAGLAEPPVLVQLDVSRAFDSLHINSIL